MPHVVDHSSEGSAEWLQAKDLGYKYPMGLDLRPGSKLHSSLVSKLFGMARDSQSVMKRRWGRWERIEATLTAYALMQEDEKDRSNYVVVPISYAMLDTILTYWLSTFAAGPLFRYTGVGPEDREKAMLLELVIDNQCKRMKTLLSLHTMWRDSIAYGLGVASIRWAKEYGKRWVKKELPILSSVSGDLLGVNVTRELKRDLLAEGNVLDNISIFHYLPDPNVPAHQVDRFEFVGFTGVDSYTNLLSMEGEEPENWFNIRYLKDVHGKGVLEYREPLNERRLGDNKVKQTRQIDLLTMYVNLVPKDWGLGKKKYPEKWLFVVAGDGIIIRCQPLGLHHGRFPISVCCPTYDGYSISPISSLEIIYGLQEWADWCYRSNVDNVRKVLHNMLIIDPSIVNYDSVVNSGPGMLATIRSEAWGRGVENAMKQLELRDVTSPLLGYVNNTIELTQRVLGSSDSVQGIARVSGERRTATETRDARLSALSRIQKGARIASLQSMQDLGYMFAKHLTQFMERSTYVELVGEHQRELQTIYPDRFTEVDPQMFLDVDFDVTVSDGSMPGGEYLDELIQMYSMIRGDPETAAAFDPVRMVLEMLVRSGVRGAARFLRSGPPPDVGVVPDEQAMDIAEKGKGKPVNTVEVAAMGAKPREPVRGVGYAG